MLGGDAGAGDARVSERLRSVGWPTAEDFEREAPPPEVWEVISAQLRVVPTAPAPVVLEERRRRRFRGPTLLAAAVVLAGAVVAGMLAFARDDVPTTVELASTRLETLEGAASAEARLVREAGQLHVHVDTHDMPPPPDGSHYELWLVDPAMQDPKPLGEMAGDVDVVVPPSIDVARYPVLDVSLQEAGHAEHSGHSLLRGRLSV